MSQEPNETSLSNEDQVTQDLVNEELQDDELETFSGGGLIDDLLKEPSSTGTDGSSTP